MPSKVKTLAYSVDVIDKTGKAIHTVRHLTSFLPQKNPSHHGASANASAYVSLELSFPPSKKHGTPIKPSEPPNSPNAPKKEPSVWKPADLHTKKPYVVNAGSGARLV